ncbi:MAG TPA: TetR/AcrR family transcriptional regulator [Streptosporangiaceae bacterium]|jgi:AcrR family transcriptional regulator
MDRRNRAENQQRNRAKVLAAARAEFAERGFRDAKVDGIAARAGLTRGAVYSNFPGKRALYFAVLADIAEHAPLATHAEPGRTVGDALGAFARAWVAELPLAEDANDDGTGGLSRYLLTEIIADDRVRRAFAQLTRLDAILLGLALEGVRPPRARPARLVRVAETALTTLHGASRMAEAAPGFVEPFDIISACAHLAEIDLDDTWPPPHIPYIAPARPADRPWAPPAAEDVLRGKPAPLGIDGVVAILGLHRLEAVEEAVRAAPDGDGVSVVVVTGDQELAPLARLTVARLRACLRPAVPAAAWPRLSVVFDDAGTIAAAAGVHAVSDTTETAVRITAGRITAQADGHGAPHAAASTNPTT